MAYRPRSAAPPGPVTDPAPGFASAATGGYLFPMHGSLPLFTLLPSKGIARCFTIRLMEERD